MSWLQVVAQQVPELVGLFQPWHVPGVFDRMTRGSASARWQPARQHLLWAGGRTVTASGAAGTGGAPSAVEVTELTGRGFDNETFGATLRGGRRVVLRRWPKPRPPEHARARFLAMHRVPAPALLAAALLAADEHASLVEFAPGAVLGDLIDSGRDSSQVWRLVGEAYRRVHDVGFPAGVTGQLRPDHMQLTYHDPVADLHADIDCSVKGLRRILPLRVVDLPALHDVVDAAAEALRAVPQRAGARRHPYVERVGLADRGHAD